MINTYKLEIKWGLIFAVIGLLWMYFEKAMGWHGPRIEQHMYFTNFFALVAILVYVVALREKREQLGGEMSWKQGFVSGMVISLVVAVLSPLTQWITHNLISPEYFPNVRAASVELGMLTAEEAESRFNLGTYMWQSTVFAIAIGAITSAVVAWFLRSNKAS